MSSAVQGLAADKTHLRTRLFEARERSDGVFALVRPEALYDRPIAERHRLIFYLGHLEAFDWNLIAGSLGVEPFHSEFNKLFAFGIDPVGGGLPTDQPHDWPREKEVRAYNARVRARLDLLIRDTSDTLLHVAIEHRLMHAETLTYLLHQLPFDRKVAPRNARAARTNSRSTRNARAVTIPAGIATLGQSSSGGAFGWDNEFEETRMSVPAFNADVFPATNAEFLRFVSQGGYERRDLWSPEDWAWKESAGLTHPSFWRSDGERWLLRGMFGEVPLPAEQPAFVSHAEASAYARWAGKKLPTEAQWHRMAYGTPKEDERFYPWGDAGPNREFGNFDFSRWDATDVDAHPQGASAFGVADLLGNGWEWTSTTFDRLPGFRAFSFYPGYSAIFFDGKHYVLKGGSPRTAACMLRRSFRNWFQPHYPYIYAKFRCVED